MNKGRQGPFAAIIRNNGRDADSYAGLGEAELALDDYVAARNAFENALHLDPLGVVVTRRGTYNPMCESEVC
jgi:hypothetical protein